MFTLTKEKSKFLKVFSALINSTTNTEAIISIMAEDKRVSFIYSDFDCITVSILEDMVIKDNFEVHWDAKQFIGLITRLSSDVNIDKQGIHTKTGSFSFRSFHETALLHNTEFIRENLLKSKATHAYDFNRLNDLHLAQNFIDINDNACRYISINKKYLYSSDTILFYRVPLDSKDNVEALDKEYQLFIDFNIAKALPMNFGEEKYTCKIKLYDNDAYWSFHIDEYNLDIFINYQTFSIPDLDTDEYREQYIHDSYAIVNTKEFYDKLYIMSVSASQNLNNSLYFIFEDNKLYFHSKNDNSAKDYIDCKYNPEVEGVSLLVNCKQLMKLKKMFSKNIKISFAIDKPAMRFQDYESGKEDNRLILYARLNDI